MKINSGSNHLEDSKLPFILLISCVASIGGFLFGFDSGVINGTIDGLQKSFQVDSLGTGLNVSSMLLGCAVGAFIAGQLADVLGRKGLLVMTAVLFIVSAFGSGIARSSAEFIFYRIIGGLAVGAASVITPAYISEIAPANIRGRLSSIQQLAIIFGLFCAFSSNYFLAHVAGSSLKTFWLGYETWRWMYWVELAPATLFLLALMAIPESPRYLVLSRQYEKAAGVLTQLIHYSVVEAKIDDIKSSLNSRRKAKFTDLFVEGWVRPVVLVAIGLAVFQQLVGINVVFYYGAVLWQSVGFSEADALLINVISGAVSIAGCVVALSLIDKIGRKPLLMIGSVGMAVTLAVMATCFALLEMNVLGSPAIDSSAGVIALTSAILYLAFFNISWGPVMWVMLGEMFPNQIRGAGLAVAGLFQWLANFCITMSFPLLLNTIGLAMAYGVYALFSVFSIVFVMRCVTETKSKELEEMDD